VDIRHGGGEEVLRRAKGKEVYHGGSWRQQTKAQTPKNQHQGWGLKNLVGRDVPKSRLRPKPGKKGAGGGLGKKTSIGGPAKGTTCAKNHGAQEKSPRQNERGGTGARRKNTAETRKMWDNGGSGGEILSTEVTREGRLGNRECSGGGKNKKDRHQHRPFTRRKKS